ncbi:MAG: hypothetical protein JW884_12410 [Deltaproteobacteria bacterium]|nr:hypothetical protein [Deltaproteobacteria bacterium]
MSGDAIVGQAEHFHVIALPAPLQGIYRRMGYREGRTALDPARRRATDSAAAEAAALIALKGAMRRLGVYERSEDGVVLETGDRLHGVKVSRFLQDCDEVLLMGATAGRAVIEEAERLAAEGHMDRAVVYDAAASEMVDGALDWIMSCCGRFLLREGRILLEKRYSAGYGDFAIDHQPMFHRLLDFGSLGVTVTESFMLAPEKSVTALTGILPGMRG